MTSSTLGVAFLGAGDVSDQHARAVRDCTGAQLRGLWNRTASRAEAKAAQFKCRTYESPEKLLMDSAVDVVFVLTNLETHYQYTTLALEAGKHVLVEKPVGTNTGEIRELQRLAAEQGVVCVPGHNYIYEEGLTRARDLIQRGDLGQLVSVYVLYNIHHAEDIAHRFPGVIRQILTHHCYILLFLAGPAKRLSALKGTLHYKTLKREDIAMVNLELHNGALAHLCASFAADDHASDPWTMQVRVIGTSGSTRYSYRDWVVLAPQAAHSQTYCAYSESIRNEVDFFINHCIRKGEEPLSTLQDAIAAQQMIESMEASIEQGRMIELGKEST